MSYQFYATVLGYSHTAHRFVKDGLSTKFSCVEIEAPENRILLITGIRNYEDNGGQEGDKNVLVTVSDTTLITQDWRLPRFLPVRSLVVLRRQLSCILGEWILRQTWTQ